MNRRSPGPYPIALLLASFCACSDPAQDPPTIYATSADASADSSGCPAGSADCDKDPTNGCEIDTATSVDHCGACRSRCSGQNASATCVLGTCTYSCEQSFGDCDDYPGNGCETDIASSLAHCGACKNPCVYANAQASCQEGVCMLLACGDGFADCDGDPLTGCEVELNSSVNHCGSCGKPCQALANAAPHCSEGACGFTCNSGWSDCGDVPGCETATSSDPSNCGGCDQVCSSANGNPGCIGGHCTIACADGFADCNADSADGCEIHLASNSSHCGACGELCPVGPGMQGTCNDGVCGLACSSGRLDCDLNQANGCEVVSDSDPTNCGACNRDCQGGTCVGGMCAPQALASSLPQPQGIALDSVAVYWTDVVQGAVWRVSKGGGNPLSLSSVGASGPIAVQGDNVVWATGSGIMRTASAGSGQSIIVAPGQSGVRSITADSTTVFWAVEGSWSSGAYQHNGAIMAASTGAPVVLASNQSLPVAVAEDIDHVYWINEGTITAGMHDGNGSVMRVGKSGNTPATIASNQQRPCALAVSAPFAYWITCVDGKLMRRRQDATDSAVQVVSTEPVATGLLSMAVLNPDLHWSLPGASGSDGTIWKASVAGSSPATIAKAPSRPLQIAVDQSHVYWVGSQVAQGSGAVLRVAR